jgi:glycosyltransferase involved in cell wall biosynthesis
MKELKTIRELDSVFSQSEEVLLSVVVTTYNHAAYINHAIDSILDQMVNFRTEIIIHDDCSTDGTKDILINLQKSYPQTIKLILEEINQYSLGIKNFFTSTIKSHTKGTYISICEGDDYFNYNLKLYKQVLFLERNNRYVACVNNHFEENLYKNKTYKKITNLRTELSLKNALLNGNHIATNSFVFRKSIVNTLPEYYFIAPMEDYPLIIHIRLQGRVRHFFSFMSTYRYGVKESWTFNMKQITLEEKLLHTKCNIEWLSRLGDYLPNSALKYIELVINEQKVVYKMLIHQPIEPLDFRTIQSEIMKLIKLSRFIPHFIRKTYIYRIIRLHFS